MKAWKHHDSFEAGTNMKAWLYTILRNEFYTQLRKRKPNSTLVNAVGGISGNLLRNRRRHRAPVAPAPNLSREGIQAGRLVPVTIINEHLALEVSHDNTVTARARRLHLVNSLGSALSRRSLTYTIDLF